MHGQSFVPLIPDVDGNERLRVGPAHSHRRTNRRTDAVANKLRYSCLLSSCSSISSCSCSGTPTCGFCGSTPLHCSVLCYLRSWFILFQSFFDSTNRKMRCRVPSFAWENDSFSNQAIAKISMKEIIEIKVLQIQVRDFRGHHKVNVQSYTPHLNAFFSKGLNWITEYCTPHLYSCCLVWKKLKGKYYRTTLHLRIPG